MRLRLVLLLLLVSAGCAGTGPSDDAEARTLEASVIHDGLVGPTQLLVPDDSTFIVAVINGGENDVRGRVLQIDRTTGEETVLLDGLDKPTGIALLDGDLWLMERDRLTRGPIGGERIVIADDLANNGRSEGTLTVTPAGSLLYDTSGSKRGNDVVDGSGRLFEVDPATNSISEVASGFKHAYAHVFDGDDLWSVEMTDGQFDGSPAPDELVRVVAGADHGWPRCVGNNRAVAEFGGDEASCASVPASHAVFGVAATPTAVIVSPFARGEFLVALWREGVVVSVPTAEALTPHEPTTVLTGLDNPQHLVVGPDGDGGEIVYLTEFGTGSILEIRIT